MADKSVAWNLVMRPPVTEFICTCSGVLRERMEHLTCFVGGNLALGVQLGAVTGNRAASYLALAKEVTRTCYLMYHNSPTGAQGCLNALSTCLKRPSELPIAHPVLVIVANRSARNGSPVSQRTAGWMYWWHLLCNHSRACPAVCCMARCRYQSALGLHDANSLVTSGLQPDNGWHTP